MPRMRPLQGIPDGVPVADDLAFDVQHTQVAVAHGHLLERPPAKRRLLARVVDVRGGAEALRVAAAVGDRARRLRAAGHLLPGPVDVVRRLALAVVAPALEVAGAEREPARVVDDVRGGNLQELDAVGRRGLPFSIIPPALDQPRGP